MGLQGVVRYEIQAIADKDSKGYQQGRECQTRAYEQGTTAEIED